MPRASLAWRAYRRLVRTHVQFFVPPAVFPRADILKLCNLSAPFPGVENLSCPTVIIDLRVPEDDLWSGVEPKTRKVIRQAERESVTINDARELTEADWGAFLAAYMKLRSRKRNADPLGVGQIGELVGRNLFAMTTSRDADGKILSWHTYIRCDGHARLLNTVSDIDPSRDTQRNNLVGRANRLHHWQDMLRFRQQGIRSYDLGGVYRGLDDQEQINIARFKKSFGGAPADTFDVALPLTLKGRLALSLVALIGDEARYGGAA